jgi:hypothetical protein
MSIQPRISSTSAISRTVFAAILLACLAIFAAHPAAAQQQTPRPPVIPGMNPTSAADQEHDPALRGLAEKMAMQRNQLRQQRIVSDTARLLQLAQKLNGDVSKSDKDELSLSVIKEADEIEKLAKSIKQKMRDGQ